MHQSSFQESLTQQAVVVKDMLAKAQNVAQPFLEAMQKLQEKLVEVIKKREKPSKTLRLRDGPFRLQCMGRAVEGMSIHHCSARKKALTQKVVV